MLFLPLWVPGAWHLISCESVLLDALSQVAATLQVWAGSQWVACVGPRVVTPELEPGHPGFIVSVDSLPAALVFISPHLGSLLLAAFRAEI